MNKPAYDQCYLDDMYLKIRYLFKLIARNCKEPFSVICQYMNGEYRRGMDLANPKYLNKTPKQILGDLNISVDLDAFISEQYDEFVLEWMADIYTYLQWHYGLYSSEIVQKITPDNLYQDYYPLHEASITRGAEKLYSLFWE